jgi:peptidoglycan/LPS O-acetylase OafA/YrhL
LVARWQDSLALSAAALAPIAVMALAFPEGGWEPFAPSSFWPALAGVLLIAGLLPQGTLSERGRRMVRVGAALYALALIGSFALHTPVGGNAARLGALFAGPLLAGALWDRHRLILCVLAPLLLYWQLETPIHDESAIAGDPSVQAAYYAPLRAELRRLNGTHPPRRTIVEVPLTESHWEAADLAGHEGIASSTHATRGSSTGRP